MLSDESLSSLLSIHCLGQSLINEDGLFPESIHGCALEERGKQFGRFQLPDCRCQLCVSVTDFDVFVVRENSRAYPRTITSGNFGCSCCVRR